MKSRKSSKIKQLAVKGLVSGKLRLGRVRPKPVGVYVFGKTMYGASRPIMMSELDLKLAYNKDLATAAMNKFFNVKALKAIELAAQQSWNKYFEDLKANAGNVTYEIKLPGNYNSKDIEPFLKEVVDKQHHIVTIEACDGVSIKIEHDKHTLILDPIKLTPEQIEEYEIWCKESYNVEDLKQTWLEEVDNTFLLRAVTTYFIHVGEGYILIDNRKYRFELEDLNLSLDMDGDWVSTHMLHSNLVCNASSRIGRNSYKKIKILGEL